MAAERLGRPLPSTLVLGFGRIGKLLCSRLQRQGVEVTAAARKAEDAIAHLNQEQERLITQTREQQAQLKKDAAAERDRMIALAREQARVEAQKIMDEAKARIAEEKEDALRDMRREVSVLSLAIAEQILRKELKSDKSQKELVDKLVDELSGSLSDNTDVVS